MARKRIKDGAGRAAAWEPLSELPELPEQGAWPGPVYCALGVLAADGERVPCHSYARW